MAMVAAGIANGGTVMQPYLVDEVQSPDLSTCSTRPTPRRSEHAISLVDRPRPDPDDGRGRRQRHRHAPRRSRASRSPARPAPPRARPTRPPYAWFVSFAPADDPKVAVAVLVQDAGVARDEISGSGLAAPIAKAVMEAVISK